ncbi:MAG: hypothetical protein HY913_21730 [Desulfomonile tiedjei]|nr:hypothetical protein [Desulfomonile tiedjei]
MKEKGSYDRLKFVEDARASEQLRLDKVEAWKQQNQPWIKENGPMPFDVPKLIFDGK